MRPFQGVLERLNVTSEERAMLTSITRILLKTLEDDRNLKGIMTAASEEHGVSRPTMHKLRDRIIETLVLAMRIARRTGRPPRDRATDERLAVLLSEDEA